MSELVTRARGLGARLVSEGVLTEIEHCADRGSLAIALGHAGLAEDPSVDAIEAATRARTEQDFATLYRWARSHPAAMMLLELDEDRRSVRVLVRGLAAGVGSTRRRAGCVATSWLNARRLTALSEATSLADFAEILEGHPLRAAFNDLTTLDILALEAALTRTFARCARMLAEDTAITTYLAQLIDGENAEAALLLAARGRHLDARDMFVAGGTRLSAAQFERAAVAPLEEARALLAAAFAGTPLERALVASSPSAVEEAVVAWQLAAQKKLRRTEPHGLASVLYLVLRRRDEVIRLRRVAWRFALGAKQ